MSNRQFRLLFFLFWLYRSKWRFQPGADSSQPQNDVISILYTQLSMFSTVTRGDDTDANVSVEFTRSLPISTVETFFPRFFSCLRYSKIKLFLLRSPLISCYFFVLSSPFGNNNKRRSRQFITDENQLRRVVVPPVRGTGPLGCFLMDGNNMAKQQQQQPH